MNVSSKTQSPLKRVEIDEWQVDLRALMQLADLDAFSDDENLSELVSKNDQSRVWVQAVIDQRTKVCLGFQTSPKEITLETLLAWIGKYK